MKKIKIITALALISLLFGCSPKPKTDISTTTAAPTTAEIRTESTEKETTAAVTEATHTKREKQTEATTAPFTKKKPATTVKITQSEQFIPTGRIAYYYSKNGNYYYTDDREVAEAEKAYSSEGIIIYDGYGASLEETVVNFTYGGKDWRISSYKGIYGYRLAGSDTIVYTVPEGVTFDGKNRFNRYCIPDEENRLNVQIEALNSNGNRLFITDYAPHWWANGYVESDIQSPDEIFAKTKIAFKDAEMAGMFVKELENNGFTAADSEKSAVNNTYFMNGNEVIYIF